MNNAKRNCSGAFIGCVLSALSACMGGQTGDGKPEAAVPNIVPLGGDSAMARCKQETVPLEDLSTPVLAFSPADVLAIAEGVHSTQLLWGSSSQVELTTQPDDAELSLEVMHDGGEVRLRGCPAAYEIDVVLHVTTRGGALQERLDATLVATSADAATFTVPLDPATLSRSLEIRAAEPPGGVLKHVALHGTLSTLGTYGRVSGVIEWVTQASGMVGATSVPLAAWPADDRCVEKPMSALPVGLDDDLGGLNDDQLGGVTLATWLDILTVGFPRKLHWEVRAADAVAGGSSGPDGDPDRRARAQGGEPGNGAANDEHGAANESHSDRAPQLEKQSATQLTLSLSSNGGCASAASTGGWFLEVPVAVQVTTDDASWQTSLAGTLTTTQRKGEASEAALGAGLYDIAVGEFESSTGMSGLDLSAYDAGALRLSVRLPSAAGSIEAMGLAVPDCASNPPEPQIEPDEGNDVVGAATAGCSGVESTVLRRGVF